jgi:2-aminoethylphosphonate-pyruvate transaminase
VSPAPASAAQQRFRPPSGEEPPLLLNPGPINVSARVGRALLRGDLCHREPEWAALQGQARALLLELFAGPAAGAWGACLLTGSGTAAMEAAVSSLVPPGKRLLVLQNGVYGERLAAIARAHGIELRLLEAPWTTPQDPAALAAALRADPEIAAVAGVHHETTTGLLNPVRELGQVCRAAGRTFLVDAISSIGGEELDLEGWGVDAVIGTANKCIRALPGLSFVLARRALLERAAQWPARTLYLHLPRYFQAQEQGGVPFTPAVQVGYALHEALLELREETVAARCARYRALAAQLRAGFARLGLEPLVAAPHRSHTITTLRLPPGWGYAALHDALRAQGLVIYAGQGALEQTAFRIANMGLLDEADCARVLLALEGLLARAGAAR